MFDVDGVLRDSSIAADTGYRKGFEAEGIEYPYKVEDTWHLRGLSSFNDRPSLVSALLALIIKRQSASLHEILEGPAAEEAMAKIVREAITSEQKPILSRIVDTYKKFFLSEEGKRLITDCPFAEQTVRMLSVEGYKLAILTSSDRISVQRDLPYSGIFNEIVTEADVKKLKPSGEGLELIMSRLGIDRSKSIYIGDAASDIRAAKDARCISVAVLTGMGTKMHLQKENPDFIINNLSELKELLWEEK